MRFAVLLSVPVACAWAKHQERMILRSGIALSASQRAIAERIGILYPERIRLLAVKRVPPSNSILLRLGEKFGFVSGHTIGMTLRYGIFIRSDHWGEPRLLVHELAHVAQYERLGGFAPFLLQYLHECIHPGYPLGELEQEAKRAESAFL
jgi:hypothetical protein